MSKDNKVLKAPPANKTSTKFPAKKQQIGDEFGLDGSGVLLNDKVGNSSLYDPYKSSSYLIDPHLSSLQRQALISEVGQAHGNEKLSRLIPFSKTRKNLGSSLDTVNGADVIPENAVQRDRKTTTYDFEPEQVTVDRYQLGGAGKRPYDVIQDHVSKVSSALENMRTGELGAIEQFLTHMSFSSATEAKPDVLGAIFKHVGKEIWSAAIDKLPNVAGVSSEQIFGVITAMTDELERAANAQRSFELASFMATLRNTTLTAYHRAITTLQLSARHDLERQFSNTEGIWTQGNTFVTGEKASFLRNLDEKGDAILTAVPSPIQYEEALLVEWITSRSAGGSGSTGWEGNGKIQLRFDTEVNNGSYSYEFESAELFTSTKSGNAADMFNRIMKQQNKKVYELGVPVQVMLRTEGMVPGGRSYYAFWIRNASDFDQTHYHEPALRAWNQMPWEPIDQVKEIEGSE